MHQTRFLALFRTLLLALPVVFLLVFYLYPLAAIVGLAFGAGTGWLTVLADSYYLRVFWFTIWQAALSTALTLGLGLPAAFVFARYTFPGKGLLLALSSVPFVLPTVVVAAAFAALIGPRGPLNTFLQSLLGLNQPPIQLQGTLSIVLAAHVFYNLSVVLRLVGGFWATLDPRLEQAAAVLGANPVRVFRTITLPLLLPSVGAAALLVFIFCFTSFGVVVVLGGPRFATLEVEVYRQTAQLLRLDVAAALSLVQIGCTLLLTLLYTRLTANTAPLALRPAARSPRSIAQRIQVAAAAALLLAQAAPLLALVAASLGSSAPLVYYRALAENRTGSLFYVPPLVAIRNSLLIATATTLLALVLGVLAAVLLTRRPTRSTRHHAFIPLLDALFVLPLGTSAITLGLGYLVAFGGPPLPLRSWPGLLVIAHTLVALPFVLRALLPALRTLDPQLRQAAAMLGEPPYRVLLRIDLPLLAPALLAGASFAFSVSLGEFGATLLLARPDLPTLPILIFRFLGQPGALNYGQAMALSCILMLTTTASFLLLQRGTARSLSPF